MKLSLSIVWRSCFSTSTCRALDKVSVRGTANFSTSGAGQPKVTSLTSSPLQLNLTDSDWDGSVYLYIVNKDGSVCKNGRSRGHLIYPQGLTTFTVAKEIIIATSKVYKATLLDTAKGSSGCCAVKADSCNGGKWINICWPYV